MWFPRADIFHCKQMRLTENKKILNDVVANFWQSPLQYDCVLEEEQTKKPTIDLVEGVKRVFGEDVPIEIIEENPKRH